MKLYINGNPHVSAAMATNNFTVASDDNTFEFLADAPHPDNLLVSWGNRLSQLTKTFMYISNPSYTNEDIVNSSNEFLYKHDEEMFVIIGWNSDNSIKIFNFHLLLKEQGIRHIFFDTNEKLTFNYDFGANYLPVTYTEYLKDMKYETVNNSDEYFGADAHAEWAKYLLLHIAKNEMM